MNRVLGRAINYERPSTAVMACCAFFLIGAAAGLYSGAHVGNDTGSASAVVREYIGYISSGTETGSSLPALLFANSKSALLALFLASSIIGVFLLPMQLGLSAFGLGFSASSSFYVLGSFGNVFALFGPDALVVMPCLFVVSVRAIEVSKGILRCYTTGQRNAPSSGKPVYKEFAFCALLIIAATLFEYFLTPKLLSGF